MVQLLDSNSNSLQRRIRVNYFLDHRFHQSGKSAPIMSTGSLRGLSTVDIFILPIQTKGDIYTLLKNDNVRLVHGAS